MSPLPSSRGRREIECGRWALLVQLGKPALEFGGDAAGKLLAREEPIGNVAAASAQAAAADAEVFLGPLERARSNARLPDGLPDVL